VDTLSDLLGQSPEILALRDRAGRLLDRWSAARRPPPVFIRGETGTGKGMLARLIHRASPRADKPIVAVNCAAIPETLMEAELFGYERGAFTDARQPKPGLFQLAHRGTLFLDEVGLLTAAAQGKLLSALEEGVVRRLGGTRSEPVDVWVIAATNETLDEQTFRQDLFHRLAVFTLELPPLRSRAGDILVLAEHFIARACADYGLPLRQLAPDAQAALTAYAWPGNVRELLHAVEAAIVVCEGAEVQPEHLPAQLRAPVGGPGASSNGDGELQTLEALERAAIERALRHTQGHRGQAAKVLGISERNLYRKLREYGFA
jgi:DNA-binding NtrC family response regulator